MTKRTGLTVVSLAVLLGLPGCGNNTLIRTSGEALNLSFAQIRPNYELGLRARSANAGLTIGEFLEQNGATPITESERLFMSDTANEHQQTIDELRTFGEGSVQ